MVVGEDYYYSDTDSDDDVDRYMFLARRPAPAGRHAQEDASSDSDNADGDDDGDGTADEEEEDFEGGGARRKRPRGDVLDASPSPKKARLGLIASPLPPAPPSRSDRTQSSPCHGRAHEDRSPRDGGVKRKTKKQPREGEVKAKTKKQGVCGKRCRGLGCEEDDGDRESCRTMTAAASGSFPCNLCERCFDSHQALGGHVLGHRKKAKIAIAAACLDDDGGSGNCKKEISMVEVSEEAANGTGHADKKAVVPARCGDADANGNGNCNEKKTADDVAEHDEDVDGGGHVKAEQASVDVENHKIDRADGNSDMKTAVFAQSHEGVNGNDRKATKAIAASSRGFTNRSSSGNEEMDIGAASHNGAGSIGNVRSKKTVVGACDKGANGNGSSNVCKKPHKCKVCGTECPTGRALGGHMRKHRKQPAHGGDGGGSPASAVADDDCQTPLARLFG